MRLLGLVDYHLRVRHLTQGYLLVNLDKTGAWLVALYHLYLKKQADRVHVAFLLDQESDDAAWGEVTSLDRREFGVELWRGERLVGSLGPAPMVRPVVARSAGRSERTPAWHRIPQVVA